jgi:UDP-glucose 4-epimerase
MVYRRAADREDTPRQPINPYGMSNCLLKMAWNLMIARMLCDLSALRYFNAAGADESGEIGQIHGPEMHLNPLA